MSSSPPGAMQARKEPTTVANTHTGNISPPDSFNSLELDAITIEAIRIAAASSSDAVTFPAYMPNRQTASPELTHRPSSSHDASLDPLPLRIKSKSKRMWRSVKKAVSRGWKKAFGKKDDEER